MVNEQLRSELLRRMAADQEARRVFASFKGDGTPESETEEAARRRWQPVGTVDADNETWIRHVIAAIGWPGKSLVGDDGSHAAWLLVQHMPKDLQEQCLPLLEQAVEKGEAVKRNWAYLLDRVLMNRGEPQVFGTQFMVRNGQPEPHPIRDPHDVDGRRAELGLEPMAEYAKHFRRG